MPLIIQNCWEIETDCFNLIFFYYDSDAWGVSRMWAILGTPMWKESIFYYPIARQASLQWFLRLHRKKDLSLQLTSGKQNKVTLALTFHSDLVFVATTVYKPLKYWCWWQNQCFFPVHAVMSVCDTQDHWWIFESSVLNKTQTLDSFPSAAQPTWGKVFLWPPSF